MKQSYALLTDRTLLMRAECVPHGSLAATAGDPALLTIRRSSFRRASYSIPCTIDAIEPQFQHSVRKGE